MAIWRKDEKLYTALQDLMRTYLMHDHTPNIEQQLKEQFDSYFKWHEEHWERGGIDSFGGPTGSQQSITPISRTLKRFLKPSVRPSAR